MDNRDTDTISRQQTIDAIKSGRVEEDVIHFWRAENVKPELQTNCEYCHEDSDGYVKPIEKNCHAFVRFGMDGWELSLKANGWHGEARIKFCPMCGRRLADD